MSLRENHPDGASVAVEAGEGLTLVLFWDPWEHGSQKEMRTIAQIADSTKGRLEIRDCNVEEFPELAKRFAVSAVPTTILLKDGKEAERLVGYRHERTLARHLKKHLDKAA